MQSEASISPIQNSFRLKLYRRFIKRQIYEIEHVQKEEQFKNHYENYPWFL